MFSIFLHSQDPKEEIKITKIKKFKSGSIPFLFQKAMLARHPAEENTSI